MAGHPKRQRIHRSNRAGAHGEHIAQNAAHPCGSALMRFDIAGVIVAFHFENNGLTVADIDNTCIFTRPANDLWPRGGQRAQPFLG